ncbi:MAG: winged helix-turn-helix domain-containing protein [Clostridiales bacterium]|nr:winged helix-turn-helix domain-containing protein [Clostridiales bacterium]
MRLYRKWKPTEFSILVTEELFEAVWGEKCTDNNNTVMTYIGRLRDSIFA